MPDAPLDFLSELEWRGLIHQCTDLDGLRQHLSDPAGRPRRAYVGFDPTADSLTIGNLVPTMMLAHFQRAGHQPVVVMGGGTGLIGDPSGKSAERQLLSAEQVEANVSKQRTIFQNVWRGAGFGSPPVILNNNDWLGKLGYIEVLRDIGKHFSVNMMIQKDSVRERLHARDQGISYTEFSYMILQAYDFLHLFEKQVVTLQMGGSDQWGNIVGGIDLTRKYRVAALAHAHGLIRCVHLALESGECAFPAEGEFLRDLEQFASLVDSGQWGEEEVGLMVATCQQIQGLPGSFSKDFEHVEASLYKWSSSCFGLTAPLVTKSDGGKFGKTESGAIWLTAERSSPYAYYQFWLNAADADAGRYLRLFTFLPKAQIEAIEAAHAKDPGAREAQRTLAREATKILHGAAEMETAERAAKALFSGDIADLTERTFREVMASAPATAHDKAQLGAGVALLELLPQTSLAKSKSEAREFLGSGSVSVNGQKAAADRKLTSADLLHGRFIALRRGKKSWHVTRWE